MATSQLSQTVASGGISELLAVTSKHVLTWAAAAQTAGAAAGEVSQYVAQL